MSHPEKLAEHYHSLLGMIGEDPDRTGLSDTPLRAAKALQYLTRGYQQNLEEVVNNAIFESDNDQMVIIKDIEMYSLCEHHLLPFVGKCHIAYVPQWKGDRIIQNGPNHRHVRPQVANSGKSDGTNCTRYRNSNGGKGSRRHH